MTISTYMHVHLQQAKVVATMVGHTDRVNCVQWLPISGESCKPTTISSHWQTAYTNQFILQVQVLAFLVWLHLGQLTIMSSSG